MSIDITTSTQVFSERQSAISTGRFTVLGTILIAEDNDINRLMLAHNLRSDGYTVIEVVDGVEALDCLRESPPDLVLLDIQMPRMDGKQVLQAMKADEQLRHLPVVMITVDSDLKTVVQCVQLGADDYLVKPFEPVLLRARINMLLERKFLRDREVALHQQVEQQLEELKRLSQLKDDLTHMIIHDLRTPLTSILTGLMTMESAGPLDELQSELLTMSITGGQTLLGMINDLLEISKMEDGSLKLRRELLPPQTLAHTALQQVTGLAQGRGHTLRMELPDDLPEIHADQEKTVRALVNLLGNACKFTPDGGEITLTAQHEGDHVVFTVRDNGEGIPPEAFERIFEKFGQVEQRKSGHKHSTGLGLTFCKMVVEAHGGHIWVESELEQGSTFSFTLPTVAPTTQDVVNSLDI